MRKEENKKTDNRPACQRCRPELTVIQKRYLNGLVNPDAGKVSAPVTDGKVTLTRQMIVDGRLPTGGWNRRQMQLIGLPWPLVEGWMERAVGKVVPVKSYRKFLMAKTAV